MHTTLFTFLLYSLQTPKFVPDRVYADVHLSESIKNLTKHCYENVVKLESTTKSPT